MLPGMVCTSGGAGGAGGAAEVSFIDRSAFTSALSPANATATWSAESTGNDTGSGLSSRVWLLSGAAADYELFASVTSGALTSGTTGSWLSLGTTRSYSVTRTDDADGQDQAVLACEVRRASDLVVIATFDVSITAIVNV